MKIAIISDTHDNLLTLKKTIAWIKSQKIKLIVHCGDVSKEEVLKESLDGFNGRIYLVRGNCDIDDFKRIPKLKIFDESGEIKLINKKIAFSHFPKIAEDLANSGKYDIIFYGHSHKPWIKTFRGGSRQEIKLVNPGNLAGVYYKATFAIYDTKTDKLELKILERLG
ncbi:MAG: YfcE family phosphodiesterase [Parcubacteria group bacterium]